MPTRHSASKASTTGTDSLSHIIELLRPQAVQPKLISGAGNWGVRYSKHEHSGFTLVLEGSCFLAVDGIATPFELRAGDFFLMPQTFGFTMSSHPDLRPKLATPAPVRHVHHGSTSAQINLRMLGGYFQFDRANVQLLVKLLPPTIHVRNQEMGAGRLRSLAELISDEAGSERPGRDTIVERLVEVLLLETLRFRTTSTPHQERGLLAGLADPMLAAPLRGIHVDLSRRWTVAELARVAGMSRAAFAERFSSTVGLPPMQYLSEWRMAVAKDLLSGERPPLAELAERIGYQSASAFSTAFTRATGCAPSDYARTHA
jgi:AraC-like DNA-binding protein